MMINIYEYCTSRAKFSEKYKTAGTMKKQLIKKRGKICYLCKNKFDKSSELEYDHKIPIEVGGHLFEDNNVDLACVKCHREKTRIDIKTINMLKKNKIIMSKYYIRSYFEIGEVVDFFIKFRKIVSEIDTKEKIYNSGHNGVDYIQVIQKSNRKSYGDTNE